MVAVKDDGRGAVEREQVLVGGPVEEAGAVDPRDRVLVFRADVEELERFAPFDHRLQVRSGQLGNAWSVGHRQVSLRIVPPAGCSVGPL
jgi:hypothetical protein